jgi:hypothetical protein
METYAQVDASSALYFGEEVDSIINDAMCLLFADGEASSNAT